MSGVEAPRAARELAGGRAETQGEGGGRAAGTRRPRVPSGEGPGSGVWGPSRFREAEACSPFLSPAPLVCDRGLAQSWRCLLWSLSGSVCVLSVFSLLHGSVWLISRTCELIVEIRIGPGNFLLCVPGTAYAGPDLTSRPSTRLSPVDTRWVVAPVLWTRGCLQTSVSWPCRSLGLCAPSHPGAGLLPPWFPTCIFAPVWASGV